MATPRGAWAFSGVLAGLAGLATSHVAAMWLTIRDGPFVAVGQLVVRLTPGPVTEQAIGVLGSRNKLVLVMVLGLILLALFAYAGHLARRHWWRAVLVYAARAGVGVVAALWRRGAEAIDLLPVVIGLMTWLVALAILTVPLQAEHAGRSAAAGGTHRRPFLVRAGVVVALATGGTLVGNLVGRRRRRVEETRRLLRLPMTMREVSPRFRVDDPPEGLTPWRTPNESFYRIHTALVVPTIDPTEWTLRIHGMVDREVVLTYRDLLRRPRAEAWLTLNCVSNEVGGDLVGNAWWSGVRVADLLAEAGVQAGADAVLQTSEDGWNCATPLEVLTDERDALLAYGMNSQPLPLDHGFPVRTIVPGLYGYVSACKWVVDLEVTRFDRVEAYWTQRGWGEQGPVKVASRIDVPAPGQSVPAGTVRAAGVAWFQHTGIAAVEVQLDGGAWQRAELGGVPSTDTWVQWVVDLEAEPGEHLLRVRAIDRRGAEQTGIVRDVLPDGATGWHEIEFTAQEET
ncbi:molybdopterin-dependent oxidoreductase [Nocardioides sp.]|uniref:molybdopterin-dependent oxidoreductase n=1 Tax=Nocardioides sp. TaxID=35761 RepID=UPI0027345155|nr:molybdopterin-dependent oxidoreductase [Nocardioides sp.]MDP3892534.1 molybdopterin-dependent oxidoreductase [Nocardioides sp.]